MEKHEVLYLHQDALDRFGGLPGLRDEGGLESALAQPRAAAYGTELHPTVFEKAAAYLFHISENQPFVDGNKRTAWKATAVFLEINGFYLDVEQDLAASFVIEMAEMKGVQSSSAQETKSRIAVFLEENSRPRDP